ncbi:MAG TPA: hypothetical protein VH062_01990 [Polyangiaceae bacterium]|jgi:hypothetical protein|nr:hypothetical protein [Polyangiaceae bacterium]
MSTVDEHPVHRAARQLAEWAYCDSMIELNRSKLRELLSEDEQTSGYLPSDEQCMQFICGGDDGAPPPDLVRDFPKTHAWLEEFWS